LRVCLTKKIGVPKICEDGVLHDKKNTKIVGGPLNHDPPGKIVEGPSPQTVLVIPLIVESE